MMAKSYRASDVFGITRAEPLNYSYRPSVDDELVDNLARDKHLVIYGSSKQGKTSLRKHHLKSDEYTVLTCANTWSVAQLMGSLLKQVGYSVEQTTKKAISGEVKISVKAKIKAAFLGSGAETEAGLDASANISKEVTEVALELDPADVNGIIGALKQIGFKGWIVLEDFHYLPDETQRQFAVTLKAFHENSEFTFIIVGVWLQENRLVQYNGDLTGRVTTINADKWLRSELLDAVSQGEKLLNVAFSDEFKTKLIDESYDSIYVVQEACYAALQQAGLHETSKQTTRLDPDAAAIVKEVVDKQSARYMEFLVSFAQGFGATELQMYRWLLVPIVMSPVEEQERGLELREISRILKAYHPRGEDLNPGNITQALSAFANLQVQHRMTPIVFDYDQSHRRLNVVDRSFLIWLNQQDKTELLESINLPGDIAGTWEERIVATRI